jgi:Protein of unknown function (DUF3828)
VAIMQGLMFPRRSVLMAACGCVVLAAVYAHAADPSAKSFVEGIYAAYKGKDARGVALDSDAAVRRYFEPKLAALILKDRREARGEVDKLDADPFVDAQDWEIDTVDIAIREIAPDKASATVSFKSLGEQRKVVLALVKLRMGWRIADITWDRNGTLRELMSK